MVVREWDFKSGKTSICDIVCWTIFDVEPNHNGWQKTQTEQEGVRHKSLVECNEKKKKNPENHETVHNPFMEIEW